MEVGEGEGILGPVHGNVVNLVVFDRADLQRSDVLEPGTPFLVMGACA